GSDIDGTMFWNELDVMHFGPLRW
ncbi:hypothetical protein L195_g064026, partial [Trifolium pratense]